MKLWMITYNIGTEEELNEIEKNAKKEVLEGKKAAWEAYLNPIKAEKTELITLIQNAADKSINKVFIQKYASDLESNKEPLRKDLLIIARKVLRMIINEDSKVELSKWIQDYPNKRPQSGRCKVDFEQRLGCKRPKPIYRIRKCRHPHTTGNQFGGCSQGIYHQRRLCDAPRK